MSDITSEKLSEVSNLPLEEAAPIGIELFNKRSARIFQLINNADATKYIPGQNREHTFELTDALYVNKIEVFTKNYASYNSAQFVYQSTSGNRNFEKYAKNGDNKFTISVNDFVTSFSFKPEKNYFDSPEIQKVVVTGYTKAEFIDIASKLDRLEQARQQVHDDCKVHIEEAAKCNTTINLFEQNKKTIEDSIAQLSRQKAELEESISDLTSDQEEIKSNITSLKSAESDVISRVEKLEDAVDKKKKEMQSLNTQLVDSGSKLQKLQDDVNMFPSEISGFVDQGAKNITRYTWLAALPIFILGLVTYRLFSNAVDLTQIYKFQKDLDVWAVFLTRLPYVIVSVTIITACYEIAKIFISEIMKINQQRLNLSKISIIAKDVSDASFDGTEYDVGAKYALRTKLKMDLLKEHLKGYLPVDYEFKDNETSSILARFKKLTTPS